MKPQRADLMAAMEPAADGLQEMAGGDPELGQILRRLRTQRGLSMREVAEGTGLSVSFLSAVERGTSDIAFGRLRRLAEFFDHDVGSLLGYTNRRSQPQRVTSHDRVLVERGDGVRYEVLHVPGVDLEIILVDFEPHSAFKDEITHPGVDIILVTDGDVVATIAGVDYTITAGECWVWSGAYRHTLRNDSEQNARLISITTESVY